MTLAVPEPQLGARDHATDFRDEELLVVPQPQPRVLDRGDEQLAAQEMSTTEMQRMKSGMIGEGCLDPTHAPIASPLFSPTRS